jgi:hypothetical protein
VSDTAERLAAAMPGDAERSQIAELKKARAEDAKTIQTLYRELGILTKLGQRDTPPKWLSSPPKRSEKHHATPWLFLSDLHLDEVVNPAEIGFANAYNRDIAKQRLNETIVRFVKITRDFWSGITYDGIVCALGGDLFSGDIHEELSMTNEDSMLGSIDYWIDQFAAAIVLLADEFGKVHVPVVVGNHGRRTRKPRAKGRARDNFDWFIGKALQRIFANDPRVTFDVSESADCIIPSYGRKVLLTHGDQVSGGAGIGGIWPPIMRLDARKSARQAAVNQPYDLMILGHWHQLVFGPKFIVNGSLKGLDEYAFIGNFGFEPPQQACWLMTPEHGRTFVAPILPQDRQAEGW